jgi:hypothetical protein
MSSYINIYVVKQVNKSSEERTGKHAGKPGPTQQDKQDIRKKKYAVQILQDCRKNFIQRFLAEIT